MKEIVVISGKGGTGKTSLTAAFANLADKMVLCDADVDAADLHLIMNPAIRQKNPFQGGHTAIIEKEKCTECGVCRDLCRWDAIDEYFNIIPIECEGCGVCYYFCPQKAIEFPLKTCGEWFISDTRFGPMVHARLGIAEENSGRLVTLVRQEAKKLGEKKDLDLILTDGPPGVGCPVIASLGGADALLIVAEPTVSGRHDMIRVAQLAEHFKVPGMVCINKYDLNPEETSNIEKAAVENNLDVVGRIPFDEVFIKAMVQGKNLFEYGSNGELRNIIMRIWERIVETIKIE